MEVPGWLHGAAINKKWKNTLPGQAGQALALAQRAAVEHPPGHDTSMCPAVHLAGQKQGMAPQAVLHGRLQRVLQSSSGLTRAISYSTL